MQRNKGPVRAAQTRLLSSLVAMLAGLTVLLTASAHAAPAEMASCMPEAAAVCCDGIHHADDMQEASAIDPAEPDAPCSDMDCAAMTACASAPLAVLLSAGVPRRLVPERHAGPADAAKVPQLFRALPKQPPRV